ncbi:hypothetical protein [Herbaspirillum sp. RV1423]|uniref:hypothetical protein n=1 Tax=Herbaspirillum sp. RV1423 TaxID=1443993 RepID=UPI0012DC246A|nr:hypothetical protein [Herbaspirillum sp. RV1423]
MLQTILSSTKSSACARDKQIDKQVMWSDQIIEKNFISSRHCQARTLCTKIIHLHCTAPSGIMTTPVESRDGKSGKFGITT